MNKITGLVLVIIGCIWVLHWLLSAFAHGLMFITIGFSIISHHISIIMSILLIIFGISILRK